MKKNRPNCNCFICRNDLPFEFPKDIIHELQNNNIVIFAGAGISTEPNEVFKFTLYKQILDELDMEKSELSFPELMSKFCGQKNGRIKFLNLLRQRFDYVHQYPEIYEMATRFHRSLQPFWMIDTIITTNWDDYFERECSAIPIVSSEDFAFHNISGRKVYKIHGSINNYGSIIATSEDYKKCYHNLERGLIGSYLKTILASKTIIFVGYSFNDFTFNKIYEFIQSELKDLIPHSYIITLDEPNETKFKKFNSTVIKTDASYFFSVINEHLVNNEILPPKKYIDEVMLAKYHIINIRQSIISAYEPMTKYPATIYAISYLDGVEHAYDYLLHNSKSGISYNYSIIINMIQFYEKTIRKRYLKSKAYWDVAYIDGYIFGLKHISFHGHIQIKDLSYLYLYGIGVLDSIKDFKKAVNNYSKLHKSGYNLAETIFQKSFNNDKEIILRHRAFL